MIQFDPVDHGQETTHKQDEQIVSLAEQQTLITARDIANKLTKTGATVNEREKDTTALERSRSQIQSTSMTAIVYRSASKKSFKTGSR